MKNQRPTDEERLARAARKVWGDNAPEYLAGALVSVVTKDQVNALIKYLNDKDIQKITKIINEGE